MLSEILSAGFLISLLAGMIRLATPILLPALGQLYTQRAGILNLGVEGIMAVGAIFGYIIGCSANSLLVGIAAALKEPGALDDLSGRIRLCAVPAEELIEIEYRMGLQELGVIRYLGGKTEFLHRGYFDGVDAAFMVHTSGSYSIGRGSIGCMSKKIIYKGKAAHAGGAPHLGINAQYAAMLGMQAANDLRETFQEKDTVRFHPIMMGVNVAVNIIPDEMKIESYVRGGSIEAMKRENKKINRALTGAALAMGAGVELCDRPGYSPEVHDVKFMQLVEKCCGDLVGADRVRFNYTNWGTGSSDFGDITCVMPGVQFFAMGVTGTGHGIDYCVADPNRLCVNSVKAQLFVTDELLGNDGAAAKEIIDQYEPQYPSIKAYLEAINELILDKDAVQYDENGNATMKKWWEVTEEDIKKMTDATVWCEAGQDNFRGGGFSSHYTTKAEMPCTMIRLNLVKGLGPVLQIAEGWTVNLPDEVSDTLMERTNPTWPCTWFAPRCDGKEGSPFKTAYDVMNNWGANHGAISYGHIGADLITLCSILRIPVCMHNVPEDKIFRPAAWNAFGMDKEGADYRACAAFGPIYK